MLIFPGQRVSKEKLSESGSFRKTRRLPRYRSVLSAATNWFKSRSLEFRDPSPLRGGVSMTWTYAELLLATGFMGGLTMLVWGRWIYHRLVATPTLGVTFSPKGGCTEAAVREINAARH